MQKQNESKPEKSASDINLTKNSDTMQQSPDNSQIKSPVLPVEIQPELVMIKDK